jgi:ABC-type antimicrobial peptide transport system permease subunit
LYSNTSISPSSDGTYDPKRVVIDNFPIKIDLPFNLTTSIKILVQEGLRNPYSLDTEKDAVIQIGGD